MIVYQVKDTAACTCGQPLIAEDFRQAKLAVGRLLSTDSDLGSRASKILVEYLGDWNGIDGFLHHSSFCFPCTGSSCVQLWNDAVSEAAEADAAGVPFVNPKMVEVKDVDLCNDAVSEAAEADAAGFPYVNPKMVEVNDDEQ